MVPGYQRTGEGDVIVRVAAKGDRVLVEGGQVDGNLRPGAIQKGYVKVISHASSPIRKVRMYLWGTNCWMASSRKP